MFKKIFLFILISLCCVNTLATSCLNVGVIGEYKEYTDSYNRYFGREVFDGASIAVKKNKTTCVNLIPIETHNSLADIQFLIKNYAKKGVHIFLGLGLSSQAMVAEKPLKETKSILFTPTASSEQLRNTTRIISFFPSEKQIVRDTVKFLRTKKVKAINVIYSLDENNDYSQEVANSFIRQFKNAGNHIELTITVNPKQIDLNRYKQTLLHSKARYIFVASSGIVAEHIVLDLVNMGVHAQIIGSDNWGTDAKKIKIIIDKYLLGSPIIHIPVMYEANLPNSTNHYFTQKFKALYHHSPTDMEAFSYDAMNLIFATRYCKQILDAPRKCIQKILPFQTTTGLAKSFNGPYINRPVIMKKIKIGK